MFLVEFESGVYLFSFACICMAEHGVTSEVSLRY